MRVLQLIALFIALFPLSSWSECPTIDLRNSPGFKDRKQVYQTDTGWCFAFAYADIVSQKLGKAVSPVDIAIRYASFSGKTHFESTTDLDGGSPLQLKELAKKDPVYCTEENYGNITSFLSFPLVDIKRNFEFLEKGCNPQIGFDADKLFTNISDLEKAMIEVQKKSKTNLEFLTQLNSNNCKKKIDASIDLEIRDHMTSWDNEEAHEKTKQYLIQTLRSGKMLFAAIDSTLAKKEKLSFLETLHSNFRGNHAVTVTGMIEKNNQCYVRIRDSAIESTEDCQKSKISPKIDCIKDQDYDVPEDIFLKSLKITTFVK